MNPQWEERAGRAHTLVDSVDLFLRNWVSAHVTATRHKSGVRWIVDVYSCYFLQFVRMSERINLKELASF